MLLIILAQQTGSLQKALLEVLFFLQHVLFSDGDLQHETIFCAD